MDSAIDKLPHELILLIAEQIQSAKGVLFLLTTCVKLWSLREDSQMCGIILKDLYIEKFGNFTKLQVYGERYLSLNMCDHLNGLFNVYIRVWIEHTRIDSRMDSSIYNYNKFNYDVTTDGRLIFDQKKSLIVRIGPIKLPELSLEMIWLLSNFEALQTRIKRTTSVYRRGGQNELSPVLQFNMVDIMLFLCYLKKIKYCWPPVEMTSTRVSNLISKTLVFTTQTAIRIVGIVDDFIKTSIKNCW